MKKIIFFLMLLLVLFPINAFAITNNNEIKISSPNAIVMEQTTKRILFGKEERKRVKIASTTKIMTAIVVIENSDLNDTVKISKKAALTGGSTVGLKEESEVLVNSLLYGMLLKSGNDCAVALAEHVGENLENFVNMMNKKAYEIGAKDTLFTNPHGLDTDKNYSTAYDLALIMCYAKQNESLSKIMNTKTITLNFGNSSKYLANTNKLLFTHSYCDGGKTGFTNIANRCLVLSAKKNDLKIVAVVLGAPTTEIRFSDGKALLNYALDNYKMEELSDTINWYIDIPVIKGNIYSYVKKFTTIVNFPLKEGEKEKIYISQNILPIINAPLKKGSYLGNIELIIKDEVIYTKDIYLDQDITKNTVFDYMKKGILSIFNLNSKI